MKQNRRFFTESHRSDRKASLLSPAILSFACAALLLITRLLDGILLSGDGIYLSVVVLQIIIFLLPASIWIGLRGEGYVSKIRLKPGKPETLLLSLSASFVLITGGLLISLFCSGLHNLTGTFTLYETFQNDVGSGFSGPPLYLILAYAVLPAICEEILFRSILCAEYERHGLSVAVLASTVLFSFLHFNFVGLPVYLFSGFVLAVTAYLCRSVWGAIIAHFIYNLFGLFGQPYISTFYEITGSVALFYFVLVSSFLLSLALFCGETARLCKLYAMRNYEHIPVPKTREGLSVPFHVRCKVALLRPDAIGTAILWLSASILFLLID